MEITLYDQNGSPIAYLDPDDEQTIWMWDGYAVAYLDDDALYGWNGQHIGWFVVGIMYDLDGYQTGYTAETCPRTLKYEPYKSFKKFKRFRRFQRFTKTMKTLKSSKSGTSLNELLMSGSVH
jgi:hypothetical protein